MATDPLAEAVTAVIDDHAPLYDKVRQLAYEAVINRMRHYGAGLGVWPGDVAAYREAVRVSDVRPYAEAAGSYVRDWMVTEMGWLVYEGIDPQASGGDFGPAVRTLFVALLDQITPDGWRGIGDMYLPDPDELK